MSNTLHPFATSTLTSAVKHIDAARDLIGLLVDRPTVLTDIQMELLRAVAKVENVREILRATAQEEEEEAAARRRDLDTAGMP